MENPPSGESLSILLDSSLVSIVPEKQIENEKAFEQPYF